MLGAISIFMKNFYRLALPTNPLTKAAADKIAQDISDYGTIQDSWAKKPTWNIYSDPDFVGKSLVPEVSESLREVGLIPRLFVVFFTKESSLTRSFIHKDMALFDDQWTLVPFAINFETNPSTTSTMLWYDTQNLPEYYDDTEENRSKKKYLLGARYHQDYNKCSPEHLALEPMESVTISGDSTALLVRTDVAHNVLTNTTNGERCNISLRFSLKNKKTFEQAVESLKPFIVND